MRPDDVRVSVGLIVYNQEDTVMAAIDSVFEQTWHIDNLVICDDCSIDRSWELIEKSVERWSGRRHRVKNIVLQRNSENLGYLRNFQQTVRRAGGDLFVYQAGDDISLPHRIEKLVGAFIEAGCPRMALLHSWVYVDKIHQSTIWKGPIERLSTLKEFMLSLTLHIGASEAFDPRLLFEIGEISEATYDDLILGARAAMLGTIIDVPEPLMVYRTGGMTSPKEADDPDLGLYHAEATYRQRLRDAQTIGLREAELILHERLNQLGCFVNYDETNQCSVHKWKYRNPTRHSDSDGSTVEGPVSDATASRRLRILVASDVSEAASGYAYRLTRFISLERSGADIQLVWFNKDLPFDLRDFDLYWIFGFPVDSQFVELCRQLEVYWDRCVVWEIDVWPDESLACTDPSIALRLAIAQRLAKRSSIIVTSDEYLAKWVRSRSSSQVLAVPDAILSTWWPSFFSQQAFLSNSSDVVRIGIRADNWSSRRWEFVEKILWTIANNFENVSVTVWGTAPDTIRAIPRVAVMSERLVDASWPDRVIRESIDIALMPIFRSEMLSDTGDRSWLEWVAAGAIVVASRVPRLHDLLQADVLLGVPNDIDSWIDAVRRCVEDLEYRRSLAERARSYVHEHRLMRQQWYKHIQIVNELLRPELRVPLPYIGDAIEPYSVSDVERLFDRQAYQRWCRDRELREVDGETLAERVMSWGKRPHVLYITVASSSQDFTLLSVTAASLGAQFYDGWRWLVLSDRPAVDPLFETSEQLAWWQLGTLDSHDAVSVAVSKAIEKWACDWVCLLLPGTFVHPQASIEVIDHGYTSKDVSLIYHDHDHWDEREKLGGVDLDFEWLSQRRCEPYFKPGFDLLWLLQADYIGAAVWWRADWLRKRGIEPLPGAWWYASVLSAAMNPSAVYHIPQILMTVPLVCSLDLQSLARSARQVVAKRVAHERFLPVLVDLKPSICARTLHLEIMTRRQRISIVLVIQDVHFQCRETIEALQSQDIDDDEIEYVVVANRVSDPDTLDLLREWTDKQSSVRVIDDDGTYDLVRLFSVGAKHAKNDVLIFLHVDVVPIDRRMVWRLARDLTLANGGIVGPTLLRPETMMVDSSGLAPGGPESWQVCHSLGAPFSFLDDGPWDVLRIIREVPAVDPVVFAIQRDVWLSLTELLKDVHVPYHFAAEAAVRIRAQGGRVLLSPYARAAHRRGSCDAYLNSEEDHRSQPSIPAAEDAQRFWRRYGAEWSKHPAWPLALSLRCAGWQLDDVAPVRWPVEEARRPRVLGYSVGGGSGEYRVKSPLRALAQAGLQYTEVANERKLSLLTPGELLRLKPDTILLHQWIGPAAMKSVDDWRKVFPEIRVILGLDDRNDAVPEKSNLYGTHRRAHPDARAKLRRMAERCDAVVVSTPPLQAMLSELGVRNTAVHVIPNALGRDRWGHLRPPRRSRSKPRVGWIGALQHRGDLEFLIPVIRATYDVVDWVFMGMVLPEVQNCVREFHRWVSYDRYPAAIADLDLDLAVAPLAYNIFNECKSNLRLLEYGAASYPVICTDITPYRENSPPVTRLDNQVDVWVDAIRMAVRDVDALRADGEALRRWVWDHYDLALHLEPWHRALAGDCRTAGRP